MSFKIAYIPVVFFLGALTFFVCSVLGAVHAVSVAAAQTENRPVIVLDAGHGGEDGGAVGVNGVEEKTVNLAIALFVREKLEAAGYPVKMIRETDTAVGDTTLSTLNERKRSDILYRTQIVNETENCIFPQIMLKAPTLPKPSAVQSSSRCSRITRAPASRQKAACIF